MLNGYKMNSSGRCAPFSYLMKKAQDDPSIGAPFRLIEREKGNLAL